MMICLACVISGLIGMLVAAEVLMRALDLVIHQSCVDYDRCRGCKRPVLRPDDEASMLCLQCKMDRVERTLHSAFASKAAEAKGEEEPVDVREENHHVR